MLGVGSLGLLAVQVLRARGCRVLAVARTTKRLDLALALGAEAVALSGADDDTAAARAFSGREGVDLVIETAGTALAVEQAVNLCRPGGRVVLTGLPHEATALNFFWVVRRELRIIGSMIYQDEFPEAMRLLAAGAVRTDRLLSRTLPARPHRRRLRGAPLARLDQGRGHPARRLGRRFFRPPGKH